MSGHTDAQKKDTNHLDSISNDALGHQSLVSLLSVEFVSFSWTARLMYQIYSENESTNDTSQIDRGEEQKQT